MNLAETIIPKSDQLNADDLISGPITIKVTSIKLVERDGAKAFDVHFEGDNGKPYKPCKSMRRLIVALWGNKGDFAGKSMVLYRDESVVWGGIKVGGIRISHMSHIDNDVTLAMTVSRTSRKPYTVRRLEAPDYSKELAAIKGAASVDELNKLWPTLSANAKAATEVFEAAKNRKAELANI